MKKQKKKGMSLARRHALFGLLFLLPWIIGLFCFTIFPILYSFWMSICKIDFEVSGMRSTFVGMQWYKMIFMEDASFLPDILDTLRFIVFSTPMILVMAVILGLLLNQAVKGRGFFRALFFFPVIVVSGPVMNKLMSNQATAIIQPEKFAVYQVVATLPDIISVPLLYLFDNIVLILWYSGVQILIILSGLQKISGNIYEAAAIDGASKWQSFWKITIPFLKPMILVCGVYTVMDLACFSNNRISQLINYHLVRIDAPYSYSAALSWLYTLAVLLILLVVYGILKERRKER